MSRGQTQSFVTWFGKPRGVSSHPSGWLSVVVVIVVWGYYFLNPQQGFDGLVPDNIAQTAYWRLLNHPEHVGSIGSSSPKGGLILLLGSAHYICYELLDSGWLFKAFLAGCFTSLLYLVGRIAWDLGGPIAGALAVSVSAGSGFIPVTFYVGASNLFFLPLVLLGLYWLSLGRDRAGVLALSVAITIRPEAVLIIGVFVLLHCVRLRHWRSAAEFTVYALLALAVFAGLAYWVQGSWERSGGGAGTGYPAFASLRTIEHLRQVLGQFFSERFVALLLFPALFTLAHVGRRTRMRRIITRLCCFDTAGYLQAEHYWR
jgi:hypothetical protein